MRKVSIPDHVLQELADELVKVTGAKVVYKSRVIMCIKGGNHNLPFDVLGNAKDKFGDILKDYSILWIADVKDAVNHAALDAENSLVANPDEGAHDVNHGEVENNQTDEYDGSTLVNTLNENEATCVILLDGPAILTIWLTRRFGGETGGSSLWLVYNHAYAKSHYGYKGDCLPSSDEIISFVEQKFMNR